MKTCVIIPTYNNAATLGEVVRGVQAYVQDIIVVDDGCVDGTAEVLSALPFKVEIVRHPQNKGKGQALLSGFKRAKSLGFTHAITIDSDGQHKPSDIPAFLDAVLYRPDCIIVGNRFGTSGISGEKYSNMKGGSKFANKFSNFWFRIQTGTKLCDTQTGFRAYPLERLRWTGLVTSRYEAELELLVFAAWHGVPIKEIPVDVHYPRPEERVSHFRPGLDFTRISILNTVLTLLCLIYAWPKKILRKLILGLGLIIFGVLMLPFQLAIVLWFIPRKGRERKRLKLHEMIQGFGKALIRLLPRTSFTIDNPHGIDFSEPTVIISNHQSHLDLPCMMSLSPKLVIMTKKWVWNNPLYLAVIRLAEYIYASEDMEANRKKMESLVKRGYSVLIFPEGTRSASCRVGRFHQGAFHLARELGVKITPLVIHGSGLVLNKEDAVLTPGRITLSVGEPIDIRSGDYANMTALELARRFRKETSGKYENIAINS